MHFPDGLMDRKQNSVLGLVQWLNVSTWLGWHQPSQAFFWYDKDKDLQHDTAYSVVMESIGFQLHIFVLEIFIT